MVTDLREINKMYATINMIYSLGCEFVNLADCYTHFEEIICLQLPDTREIRIGPRIGSVRI